MGAPSAHIGDATRGRHCATRRLASFWDVLFERIVMRQGGAGADLGAMRRRRDDDDDATTRRRDDATTMMMPWWTRVSDDETRAPRRARGWMDGWMDD